MRKDVSCWSIDNDFSQSSLQLGCCHNFISKGVGDTIPQECLGAVRGLTMLPSPCPSPRDLACLGAPSLQTHTSSSSPRPPRPPHILSSICLLLPESIFPSGCCSFSRVDFGVRTSSRPSPSWPNWKLHGDPQIVYPLSPGLGSPAWLCGGWEGPYGRLYLLRLAAGVRLSSHQADTWHQLSPSL